MAEILIVEDNEENWDMLSRRLQRRGFTVVRAADGAQAVAAAQAGRPDLIVMDIGLPVLDGWAATRAIRELPATRSIPILALTAHAMSGDREKALQAGCDDYHAKPIEFPRLLAQIEELLRRAAAP